MPLPQICPLDNTNRCRGQDCHLFHIDWRTGEENCSIGYRYTHKTTGSPHVVEDTYARDVKLRKTQIPARKKEVVEEPVKPASHQVKIFTPEVEITQNAPPETENLHDSFPEDEEETYTKAVDEIASTIANSDKKKEIPSDGGEKKASKLDAMMNDLPEDYETEFWSDEGEKT